jgi:predicted secreted protein
MLLITGLLLAGCGELTVEDPHGTVRVRPGQEFVLEFPTNPSVGTDWRLDTRLGPNRAAAYLGSGTEPEDPGSDGGGVRKNFRFEGRGTGVAVVAFTKLFRGEPRERRRVRILVRERG